MARRSEFDATAGFRAPFKGEPQQGTLFKAPVEDLDPTGKRFAHARGFTPQRRDEIDEVTHSIYVGEKYPKHPESDTGGPMLGRFRGGVRRQVVDTLASTTIPPEDLRRASIQVGVDLPFDRAGQYQKQPEHRRGWISMESSDIRSSQFRETLAHEVGHHVSANSEGYEERKYPRENVGGVTTPMNIGPREEAFADDYAMTHVPGGKSYTYASNFPGQLGSPESEYRRARQVEPLDPMGEVDKWYPASNAQFGEQQEVFKTEEATGQYYGDANVQAYTTDEGVVGWGPNARWAPEGQRPPLAARTDDIESPSLTDAAVIRKADEDVYPIRAGGSQKVPQLWRG